MSAAPEGEIEQLLRRMRCGDREAAAQFVERYGSKVRRRVRGKLSPTMRRIFDSQEILSTVGRRLDLYVQRGGLEAQNEDQVLALLVRIADNAVIDKRRVLRRLELAESEDGPIARCILNRLREADRRAHDGAELELEATLNILEDPIDRQILSQWLLDVPQTAIAELVGISHGAVRQRWTRMKLVLRDELAPGSS
jgi:DNA-directed RNA polymerase specialized sigma24 family protein